MLVNAKFGTLPMVYLIDFHHPAFLVEAGGGWGGGSCSNEITEWITFSIIISLSPLSLSNPTFISVKSTRKLKYLHKHKV